VTKNSEHPLALPVGTELVGDYVITKVLGAGGFGITYEANERSLDRTVAIKEYFPVDIVEREGWALVKARSNTLDIKYARGLRRFIEEAKTITQFNHPNIVRVLRYFKTNNTAFMVLHYEEGVDMGTWRENLERPPSEHQLEGIIAPLLDALKLIHDNDFLHRDIAPDNIIIRKDGSPILIDFGSARSELTFNSKTVSALVKSGYSPFEQYAKNSKEQGPWTDIYSFGATLYQMVTGEAPPDSLSRLAVDEIIPTKKRSKKYYSRDFLAAIDSALAVQIAGRPQSIEEWRAMLFPSNIDQSSNEPATPKTKGFGLGLGLGLRSKAKSARAKPNTRKKTYQRGAFFKNVGQSSVADLIAKAGLKPADISDNAARLAARVKAPLLKLVPHTRRKNAAQKMTPSPADGVHEPAPRSLRSLLSELDHRYEEAGHAQAKETAASPVEDDTAQPEHSSQQANAAPINKRKLIKTTKQALKKVSLPSFVSRKIIAGLAVLAFVIAGIYYFSSDLTVIASKVELPQIIRTPGGLFGRSDEALVRTLNAHNGSVTTLHLTNRGTQFVSSGADRLIKIWNFDDGSLFRSYTPHDRSITALDVKGEQLVRADNQGNISLFDLDESLEITSFKAAEGAIQSISFSGQGRDLISGANQGQLDYWEFRDGQYSRRELRGQQHENDILAIISHRRFFITGSADNTVKIWSRSRKNLIRTYRSHTGPVGALALSPKAYRMATGSLDDTIKIWSPKSRRLRRSINADQGGVLSLAFAKNGRWLASGGKDYSIKIWDARNGRLIRSLNGHSGSVRAVLFSPNGKQLISAGDDRTIRFWDWNVPRARR
jgi:WD40 repeat protein/serine/threonine protein kinase